MHRLLKTYVIGSVLGIFIELAIIGSSHRCVRNFDKGCIKSAIFNLYGWVAILLTYLMDKTQQDYTQVILLSIIGIPIIECLSGKLSFWSHGYQTWRYGENYIPMCDGYISIKSTLFFVLLAFLFIKFIYPQI